ncbi:efflux RND transporter permease subunit [Dichotomicrobium thermohalophilum]|uniref:Multidrug efflux pump subunit AcrB n=1 Tax=Dichotomicrobium thermohalophilum TaxID=933063 RepID=A0A397PDD4_9HYPH|nr:efflux RND transporter permease subunit [Dichotomicrobium thermohalophilum]RIA47520.1 multidrug efflux pump subunit AcrB [Dichotomicrobium thermohalophilum]
MSEHPSGRPGLIGLFVRHPTASNLLMLTIIVLGLFSVSRLNTQFFPTVEIPAITVTIQWSGASALDVEQNIVDAIDPELRFLDDVDKITSVAREGVAVFNIEFFADADMQKAQSDVEQAVEQVTTLPEAAEEPTIQRVTFYEPVAKIAISGPFAERTLKDYAKQIRDGLLEAGIDRVNFTGARDEEIWATIPEAELRRLDLGVDQVATRIREETRDLPSGTVEGESELQLRTLAERRTPEEVAEIEVKSDAAGNKIQLKDIAEVEPRFDDDAIIGLHEGGRAILLQVQRAVSADTLQTMDEMKAYLDRVLPTLPESLNVEVYDIRGEYVTQRLGILIQNGLQGLVLVLIVLFLFLNMRIAFWVAAGIPIAFLATLVVMFLSGQTINMISMFALIMMLGIIVDDAIVVGEETATRQSEGEGRMEAAENGAKRMFTPVTAASMTTMAAFLPIFIISGRIGDVMVAIPLVVIAVLIASLVESFLILPGHLSHSFGNLNRPPSAFRRTFDRGFQWFRDGPFLRFVEFSYDWRYTTLAFTFGAMLLAIGLLGGGRVDFQFFPSPESENISAEVEFAAGTPDPERIKALSRIEDALYEAEAALTEGEGGLVVTAFTTLGKAGRTQSDTISEVAVQLVPSEDRTIRTETVMQAWRERLPMIPGIEQATVRTEQVGPPGRDVDVKLQNAPIENLKAAAEEVKTALRGYPGVTAISDDMPYGKRELIVEVTPRGLALGFTAESVGTQLRNAFDGAIATRFPRGDEEITVRVLREQQAEGAQALENFYLRAPDGTFVRFPEVAQVREQAGFSIIQRIDGERTVSVTGDVDAEVNSVATVVEQLRADVLPRLVERYGIEYDFGGRQEDRQQSFADLQTGAIVALILIFVILAWVFGSYAKPLAVIGIVPFGLVGAIVGHLIMDMPLTIISMIGLLGLSGILVNDSIILVAQANERLKAGENLREAAIGASYDRFRAVLLTSLTTIGGLTPLLFETSRQAQFLIPMAITLVFGLAAATFLVLILVPSLLGVGRDIGRAAGAIKRLYVRAPRGEASEA